MVTIAYRRCLLPLPDDEQLEQPFVRSADGGDVGEHVGDEGLELLGREHDRRIRSSQG